MYKRQQLNKIDTELITFSDDMDGLRKVPENIPNEEILKKNLGRPLSSIPDPFGKFNSFAEHNNTMLKQFLKRFNFPKGVLFFFMINEQYLHRLHNFVQYNRNFGQRKKIEQLFQYHLVPAFF